MAASSSAPRPSICTVKTGWRLGGGRPTAASGRADGQDHEAAVGSKKQEEDEDGLPASACVVPASPSRPVFDRSPLTSLVNIPAVPCSDPSVAFRLILELVAKARNSLADPIDPVTVHSFLSEMSDVSSKSSFH